MQEGRIININSSKYTVDVDGETLYCTLRGIFRKQKFTPLVGDIALVNKNTKTIEKVNTRKNYLIRPNVANIDYAFILASTKKPDLDLLLLDKMLVSIINANITPIICFSKIDLLNKEEFESVKKLIDYYNKIGIKTIKNNDIDKFKELVSKKIVVCCGQTGAGKSSFINKLYPSLNLKTNPISESLNRGIHTTRYVSLYKIYDFYVVDTPGFSSLSLDNLSEEEIKNAFIEFNNYNCKYRDCNHIDTDGCKVSEKVDKEILLSRYENYKKFIKERNESSNKFFKNK